MIIKFNLSKKRKGFGIHRGVIKRAWYYEEDIKEFIKLIKKDVWNSKGQWRKKQVLEIIDKLVGEKLK